MHPTCCCHHACPVTSSLHLYLHSKQFRVMPGGRGYGALCPPLQAPTDTVQELTALLCLQSLGLAFHSLMCQGALRDKPWKGVSASFLHSSILVFGSFSSQIHRGSQPIQPSAIPSQFNPPLLLASVWMVVEIPQVSSSCFTNHRHPSETHLNSSRMSLSRNIDIASLTH